MAIVESVFSTQWFDGLKAEFWLSANDQTLKITRGGVRNGTNKRLLIRIQNTDTLEAWEQVVEPQSNIDQSVAGLNLDAVDIGGGLYQPPDHINLITRSVS